MTISLLKIKALEDKLTELKKESILEHDAFGSGVADKQIKAINQTLDMVEMGFSYGWDDEKEQWVAHIYFK